MPEGVAGEGLQFSRGGSPGFSWPEELPWSVIGDEFTEAWSHDENGALAQEHIEATGQSGSGKSYAIATILQQRAARWGTAEIGIITKTDDDSIPRLGWPEVDNYEDLRRYRQAIFWPKTELQGADREKYHEKKLYDLLTQLWRPEANCVVYFDEIGYVEDLSSRLKKQIRMMWREGRSGARMSVIAAKQRPIGVVRDQHSETRWKIVFPPADMGDMKRFAELLGRPADWQPVLEYLDQELHQFVIRNTRTKLAYISWIDSELRPLPSQQHQQLRSTHEAVYGRQGDETSRKS